jgi:hypothetical protein
MQDFTAVCSCGDRPGGDLKGTANDRRLLRLAFGRSTTVEPFAARRVQEAVGANVGRENADAAAVMATWAIVGARPKRPG